MPVALLNYLDRQMLASMKSFVMSDIQSIGIEANWGLMLGQFKWIYAGSLFSAVVFLVMFGLGWGFFDCNNMPILSQIVGPQLRATGYGIMNLVSISCGGLADWGFGILRDRSVPTNLIFSVFAGAAILSIF